MRNVVEEARMVLPGAQALFGFQTMAVFNNRFEHIAYFSRQAYLFALGLLVLAIDLLMIPATYRRLPERGPVSRTDDRSVVDSDHDRQDFPAAGFVARYLCGGCSYVR
jgi:hypothetical protein